MGKKFKVYDTLTQTYNNGRQSFFLDEFGELWMDSDPSGVEMSGMTKIYKAPKRWQVITEQEE